MSVTQQEIDKKKAEIKLTVTILLSDEGISAGNKMGYNNYEIFCFMNTAIDLFIEDEFYEMCAQIKKYLDTPEMKEVDENFLHYTKNWAKSKKIF